MGTEIERKFLLKNDTWKRGAHGKRYRQGYLSTAPERTIRVRSVGDDSWLTIKGLSHGATRAEYEYKIPVKDAAEMLDSLCERPLIEKTRYRIEHGGLTWEIDEFFGDNQGLVVAEVELQSAEQSFARPDWVGEEVTGDERYFNANLVARPYASW